MRSLALVVALTLVSAPAVWADDPPPATPLPNPLGTPGAATPAPAPKPPREWEPISTATDRVLYSLGVRGRGLFVPRFMLTPFLDASTELTSGGVAIEFTRRKGTLDIVTSLDFSFYTPPDGNYLGKNKMANIDTHYTQFRGLNFLSLDVAFLWTRDLAKWIAIQIGGGVGIGIVFGDIFLVNNSSRCTTENANDPEKCFPISPDPYKDKNGNQVVDAMGKPVAIGEIKPSDPEFQRKLEQTTMAGSACINGPDCAGHPWYHKSGDKPPVMVVVNFIVGFKLKLHRHFHFNINGGFRDGFVVGGGPEFVF